jgi:dolichol kinase
LIDVCFVCIGEVVIETVTFIILRFHLTLWRLDDIQGGQKVGIQYTFSYCILLYNYFWPTLYISIFCKLVCDLEFGRKSEVSVCLLVCCI